MSPVAEHLDSCICVHLLSSEQGSLEAPDAEGLPHGHELSPKVVAGWATGSLELDLFLILVV